MTDVLMVPMQIDGLFLRAASGVVAPFADFARLPWLAAGDGKVWDRNAGTPWITASVAEEPVVGARAELLPGVHLHWALPDALTRATHPRDAQGRRNRAQVAFPPVPNRWLVTRRRGGVAQKRWIVESDYLWPVDHPWNCVAKAEFIALAGAGGADIWIRLKEIGWRGATRPDGYAPLIDAQDRGSNDLGAYAPRRADILRALAAAAAPGAPGALTSFPWPNVGEDGFPMPGVPPWRHLGRTREIGAGWPQTGTPEYLGDPGGAPLTAVGYGEPSFAALYPNCRSVFGFHDATGIGATGLEYDVHGWHQHADQDLLARFDDPRYADPGAQFGDWLAQSLKWTVDGQDAPAPHGATLCYGRVRSEHFVPQAPGRLHAPMTPAMKPSAAAPGQGVPPSTPGKLELAIGASGTEALSAHLADRMAKSRHRGDLHARARDKRKIEDYLEALHLSEDLSHRRVDMGAKFHEMRHEKGFDALPGGVIWTVRATAAPDAPGAEAGLPEALATQLHALNRAQRAYERGRSAVEATRWQIYADWTRYMRYAHPTDADALNVAATRDHHDVDRTAAYLRQGGLVELAALETDAGEMLPADGAAGRPRLSPLSAAGSLADVLATRLAAMDAAVAAHDKSADARWTLDPVPAPRFHQPKDPVLLLSGAAAEPSDRHGADGARHPDGLLECHSLAFDIAPLRGDDPGALDAQAVMLERATRPLMTTLEGHQPPRVGFRRARRASGHPFMIEWEVEVAPVLAGGNHSPRAHGYDPAFIAANWTLGRTDPEVAERGSLAVQTARTSVLRGRGFFTPHAAPLLAGRLETYVLSRLREFFTDQDVPKDSRGIAYLRAHYHEVRAWFVRRADDAQAEADGAQLRLLQDGAHAPCMHGIATGGAVGAALRAIVNALSPRDLRDKAALSPFAAQCIALRRAGRAALVARVFAGGPDALPGAPTPEDLLRALALDKSLRAAALDRFPDFIAFLAGEPTQTPWPDAVRDPARPDLIPADPADWFAGLVRLATARIAAPELDAFGALAPGAAPANPFDTHHALCAMAMMKGRKGRDGDAIMAKLLRFAHFNRYFGALVAEEGIARELPSVFGLPAGGKIESGVVRMANMLRDRGRQDLRAKAMISSNVLRELDLAGEIASLAHLASVPLVRHDSFARIFHAADMRADCIEFHADRGVPEDADQDHGAMFAVKAPGGHAWSDPILTALEGWRLLDAGHGGVTQAMTGFNDALLMRRRAWQLPVADPLSFLEYKAFSEKTVRRAVGSPTAAPLTDAAFHPIRSGDMAITRLNLVDTFGQINRVAADDVVTSNAMFSPRRLNVALAPRLTQPARLNLRWLDARSDEQEWTERPASNPICGWVVLNNLDAALMIYDQAGVALGSLDDGGRWRAPPGPRGGVDAPDSIANPHLRRMVRWLLRAAAIRDPDTRGFIGAFIDLCASGLGAINPGAAEARGARALLSARPMALVRAQVSLECRDPFAVRQDFDAFSRELGGAPRSSDGFEDVLFPLRIGERDQLDDGVVGYWQESGDGFAVDEIRVPLMSQMTGEALTDTEKAALRGLEGQIFDTAEALAAALPTTLSDTRRARVMALSARGRFVAPQSAWFDHAGDSLSAPKAGQAAPDLWLSPGGQEGVTVVSVLMDPRARLHAAVGVLPTRSLKLPPEDYVDALGAISLSFLTAPVLSDANQVRLPLPKEPGRRWSWLANRGGDWSALPASPEITPAAFDHAFGPTDGGAIWDVLLGAGWIAPVDGAPARATICPPPAQTGATPLRNGRLAADLGAYAARAEDILRVLELGGRAIGGVSTMASFADQELIEGWLSLSPRPAAGARPEHDDQGDQDD